MPAATTTTARNALIAAVVGVSAALSLTLLALLLRQPARLNSDFMAFWSFPRFAAHHPIAQIYNAAALQSFQQSLYPGFKSFYPYLYPPTLLLPSWWLRFFSYAAAQTLWTLAGLALFAAACVSSFSRHRGLVLAAMLASPASLLNIATGETAYFTSALLLFGLAALPKRPILAGIAFGLLTLKPQLGVLVPILLLARLEGRAILAASLTAGALIALSCLAFPPRLWLLWAQTLPAYQGDYFASSGLNLNILVTPAANLVTLGVAPAAAWVVQAGIALLVAAVVFWSARRAPYKLTVALLLTGSFLAVPHAYAYDSIPLTAAMALALRAETPLWQALLGALVYLAPLALLSPASHWFLYALPEALLFATLAALALTTPHGALSGHEPNHPAAAQP